VSVAPCQIQKFDGVPEVHRWEHLDELFKGKAIFQVVEQSLGRNAGAFEHESATHEFGIGVYRAVIERKHRTKYGR